MLAVWGSKTVKEVNYFDSWNVRLIVRMRADYPQEKFEFFKWDFPADFDCLPVGFSVVFQWVYRAKVGWSPVQNAVVCKNAKIWWKSSFLEVVWFSHLRSGWSMWIGVGKLIQQGTRKSHQSLNTEQKSTSDCLKRNVLLSIWTNPRIIGSKDYEVKLVVVWKRSSMQRWGTWKEKFP